MAPELIYQIPEPVVARDGTVYVAQVWAASGAAGDDDGVVYEGATPGWQGWVVFIAADGHILRTPRETTQSNLDAMRVWALGLRPVYLDGALARAVPPSAELPAA